MPSKANQNSENSCGSSPSKANRNWEKEAVTGVFPNKANRNWEKESGSESYSKERSERKKAAPRALLGVRLSKHADLLEGSEYAMRENLRSFDSLHSSNSLAKFSRKISRALADELEKWCFQESRHVNRSLASILSAYSQPFNSSAKFSRKRIREP